MLIVLSVVSLEICAWIGLRVLENMHEGYYNPTSDFRVSGDHANVIKRLITGEARYTSYRRELGWAIKPNGEFKGYKANSQGLRSRREYPLEPPKDAVRIACFGDSFTHGDAAACWDTWPELLHQSDDGLEVMNFGVGGYGVDQAFLRYQYDGIKYKPDVVLIGFMTLNFERCVNVYRPFLRPKTGMPLAKPRYYLKDDQLVLQQNPMQSLADYARLLEAPDTYLAALRENDFHYENAFFDRSDHPLGTVRILQFAWEKIQRGKPLRSDGMFNVESEAFAISFRLMDAFAERVRSDGATPVMVLFPGKEDIKNVRDGKPLVYQPLKQHLVEAGHDVIDCMDVFIGDAGKHALGELIVGHYRPLGNRFVAQHIEDGLRQRGLTVMPDRTRRAAKRSNPPPWPLKETYPRSPVRDSRQADVSPPNSESRASR